MGFERPFVLVVGVVLALVVAGCSGGVGDDALSPLEPLETTEVAAATTATMAEPVTTETSETSETTEVSTSSTVEEATRPELDPANWATPLDEIFGRYLLWSAAVDVAFGPPEANPDYGQLVDLSGPDALVDLEASIAVSRDAEEVFVKPDDSVEEHVLRLPNPVSLERKEGNEVVIQDCWIADYRIESVDGEFLNAEFFPELYNVTMKVIDGEWRVFASVVASDESDGWDECNEYFSSLE